MRKTVAIGIAAASVAVVGTTVAVTSAGAATVPYCASTRLVPLFGGQQGAAGTLQDTWRLRNAGSTTCKVIGFPSVHNYRSDGRPLRTSVTHTGTAAAVTLRVGQHASFTLRYPDPGVANCTPEPATMLTIRVSHTLVPVIGDHGAQACKGNLTETALVHGG